MQRVPQFLRPALAAALVAATSVAATSVVVVAAPSVASAHTDIDYTVPADGEQLAAPVAEITVAFDDPVTLVGPGFEVLTPGGEVVQPSVFSEDGAVYFLEVTQPLAGGVAAVKYEVSAADGHVLDGGFSFTVPAAALEAGSAATTAIGATPATSAAPVASNAAPSDDGVGGSGLVIPIIAVVAVAAIAFLLLRSRLSSAT